MAAHDIMQADREIAALLTKMGHRVADDGFYIPSPMLPPQGQPHGQVYTFPPSSANHITSPQPTAFTAPPPISYHHQTPPERLHGPWYACEGYAPSTPRSQQRAVDDHVYAKVNSVQTSSNYFQFPEIKQSPRRRRRTIPTAAPSQMTMAPSDLLKEEPVTPRYTQDFKSPDVYQATGQLYPDSGYFSSVDHSPSDVISPTESVASLATVDDILRTCAVVLGDCDIGLNDITVSSGPGGDLTSCDAILSPDVNPTVVSPSVPIEISPAHMGFSESSSYSFCGSQASMCLSDVIPGVSVPAGDVSGIYNPTSPVDVAPGSLQPKSEPIHPHSAPFQPVSFLPNPAPFHLPSFKLQPVPSTSALQARRKARRDAAKPSSTSTPVVPRSKSKMLHPCQYCQRSFTSTSGLRQHENTHTGERPFKCDFCSQSFAQRSTLRTHRRSIHTKERPYKCSHCTRSFSDYSTHVKHMRTHTGVKPYVCYICGRGFTQSGNLYRHQAAKHKNHDSLIGHL